MISSSWTQIDCEQYLFCSNSMEESERDKLAARDTSSEGARTSAGARTTRRSQLANTAIFSIFFHGF